METCSALEAEIEQSRTHAAHLLQAVLKEAFAPSSQNSLVRKHFSELMTAKMHVEGIGVFTFHTQAASGRISPFFIGLGAHHGGSGGRLLGGIH